MSIRIIIGVILVSIMTTGYFYIDSLNSQLEAAAELQQKLEGVIEKQQEVMDRNEADLKKMQQLNKDLSESFTTTQQEANELRGKFDRMNLAKSASSLPTETEMKINRGTRDALRCNELVTGARLTPDEKSGKVQNNMCADVIKRAIAKESKNAK
jgi:hypothetical protein